MTTDNGNGMKLVAAIIAVSLILFMSGLFMAWVSNTLMQPAWSSVGYPSGK